MVLTGVVLESVVRPPGRGRQFRSIACSDRLRCKIVSRTFVGHVRALSRLLTAVEQASSGRTRLVLVGGEAGIGKTTLIGEATARSGLLVGCGTCADAEPTPAFWPGRRPCAAC
jgi:hypothetical protein